jgi:hypothetical protein
MKKILTILFIVFCPVCYMQAMGTPLAAINAAPDSTSKTEREIDIIATTTSSGPLRSAPAPVVSAWLVDSQISLTFLQDLGTVTVTVTGAQGEVYQASVSVIDGTELTISTQGWPAGEYTITIVRSSGQTLTGDFEL